MKKILITSFVITLFLIFAPAFLFSSIKRSPVIVDNSIKKETVSETSETEVEAVFSSTDCFKKTYYISGASVNVFKDCTGQDTVIQTLKKNDVIVAYNSFNGYLYCEDNLGNFGWIRNTDYNISPDMDKESEYTIDTSINNQLINIYNNGKVIKSFRCSTGLLGDQDNETPLGVFFIQVKGESFFSDKFGEGAKYYIKFFSNYLFHSVPVDKNGNIIEEEEKKLGKPASHGCIRLSMDDIKWMYNNLPEGTKVSIHY